MLDAIRRVMRVDELRRRFALTAILLLVYRMGFWVPLPFVDQVAVQARGVVGTGGDGISDLFRVAAMFAASDLGTATICGLGVMPYITASIVFQLLGQVYPPLEALQKDGDQGRRKINEYTRVATIVVALVQSYWWLLSFNTGGADLILDGFSGWVWLACGAVIVTSGTSVLMWVSEQIDNFGIGNGVSLLIVAGIVSRLGSLLGGVSSESIDSLATSSEFGPEKVVLLVCLICFVVSMIVCLTQCQRKVPLRSARLGQSSLSGKHFLPLRMSQAGVMPVIFASSVLLLPAFAIKYFTSGGGRWAAILLDMFSNPTSVCYSVIYVGLIFFFCYFWVAVSFNPKQIADGLKDQCVFVPGYRPGRATEIYLESVMGRLTFVGGLFLSLLAVFPQICGSVFGLSPGVASFCGGTGMLIVVSVVLDMVRRVDSFLIARGGRCILADDSD